MPERRSCRAECRRPTEQLGSARAHLSEAGFGDDQPISTTTADVYWLFFDLISCCCLNRSCPLFEGLGDRIVTEIVGRNVPLQV